MKLLYAIPLALGGMLFLSSCQKDKDINRELSADLRQQLIMASPDGNISHFRMPESDDLTRIPQDPKNRLTKEKVSLGKLLFHETGLALAPMQDISKGTYSCASCHHVDAGFQAGRVQGIADGGTGFGVQGEGRLPMLSMYTGEELDVQPVRSPSAMNGAWQEVTLWNGQFGATGANEGTQSSWTADTPKETNHLGFQGLETQAIAGLKVHRMVVNKDIVDSLGYKDLFDQAFADVDPADRYTRENAGLAIAAYERTILSNRAPFQEWLRGNTQAMDEMELRGAILFFDENKGNCSSCHTGPALNSMTFHALGMKDLIDCPEEVFQVAADGAERQGRGGFTGKAEDMYKYKTPQLYNLIDSPFYGHGSSFRSIEDVLKYKNAGQPENGIVPESQLADEFKPLNLTDEEIGQLAAFLETGLYDAQLDRYVPEHLPSGLCFPFNDTQSKLDLGCN